MRIRWPVVSPKMKKQNIKTTTNWTKTLGIFLHMLVSLNVRIAQHKQLRAQTVKAQTHAQLRISEDIRSLGSWLTLNLKHVFMLKCYAELDVCPRKENTLCEVSATHEILDITHAQINPEAPTGSITWRPSSAQQSKGALGDVLCASEKWCNYIY